MARREAASHQAPHHAARVSKRSTKPAALVFGSLAAVLVWQTLQCRHLDFVHPSQSSRRTVRIRKCAGEPEGKSGGWWDQLVWSAAENLGNARAAVVGAAEDGEEIGEPARTREELVDRLRLDYDRNYFLTGDIDVPLYTEDCEFADPFASFRGRDRFVQNLKNLAGGFITGFRVKLLDFEASPDSAGEPLVVTSRLRVTLELALPWRPTLGWVWGVTHECGPQADATGNPAWQCYLHREAWEIEPSEGVAMLFRPGKGLPQPKSD
mmetsp:Transcript_40539/g.73282  ORF Transcript_40539/g.73282 Transcript_40539/m.73282 type:complete len:266 (+) Transcript_40539:42-839(+)